MSLQVSSTTLSKIPKSKQALVYQAAMELKRKKVQESSWFFVPIKPSDKNAFNIPSNDQLAFWLSVSDENWGFGGNRSCKTETVVQKMNAACAGRHPTINGMGEIKRENGSVYKQRMPPLKCRHIAPKWREGCVAVVLQKYKEVVRRSDLRGGSWSKAWSEQHHTLYYENGSYIQVMSGEQDLDAYGGADLDIVAQDERLTYSRYLENKMRLVDRDGLYWAAMTPEEGITWEEDHVLDPNKDTLIDHWFFTSMGNPHISEEAVRKIISSIKNKQLIEAKIYGRFVPLSGLVLPQWNEEIHIIPDFDIPKDWIRAFCIDCHYRTPSAAVWMALSPDGDWFVYRTAKKPYTIPQWKEYIRAQSAGEKIQTWLGDEPGHGDGKNIFNTQSIINEFKSGVDAIPLQKVKSGEKSFAAGVYKLWDYLTPDVVSLKPKLFVLKSCDYNMEYHNGKPCPSLPWEIKHWQYKKEQKADEETLREKVRLVHNHFIDDVRYIIQTWINTEPSQAQKILPKSLEKGYLRRTV